jgi:L-lactate dehydrogenase
MEIIKLKGYTNWGIGMTCAGIVRAIVFNSKDIHPVSTLLNGSYGISDNVFLSTPCVIGGNGVQRPIQLQLSDGENEAFSKSAETIWGICKTLNFE